MRGYCRGLGVFSSGPGPHPLCLYCRYRQLPTGIPHFLAFEHIFLMGSFVALVVSNISSYEVDDYGNTDTKDEDLDRS